MENPPKKRTLGSRQSEGDFDESNIASYTKRAQKKARVESKDEKEKGIDTPIEPMKITDMKHECLDMAFDYLEVHDLLNLAHASTWFRQAAVMAMKRKRTKSVKLFNDIPTEFMWILGDLYVNGIKMCLRVLRCFGHVITCLEVDYDRFAANQRGYLDQYVNGYCVDTLVELHLLNGDEKTLKKLKAPFAELNKLTVYGAKLCGIVRNINSEWFPKMHHLELYSFYNSTSDIKKIVTIIRSTLPLQTLGIKCYLDTRIWQSLGSLTSLEKLILFWDGEDLGNLNYSVKSHMKTVKKLRVKSSSASLFNADIFPLDLLPIGFDQLEEIDVSKINFLFSLDFFARHPTIKKMTVRNNNIYDEMNEAKLRLLKTALPSLTELNVDGRVISISGLLTDDMQMEPGVYYDDVDYLSP